MPSNNDYLKEISGSDEVLTNNQYLKIIAEGGSLGSGGGSGYGVPDGSPEKVVGYDNEGNPIATALNADHLNEVFLEEADSALSVVAYSKSVNQYDYVPVGASSSAASNTIPLYSAGSTLLIGDATQANHAVSYFQLLDGLGNKIDKDGSKVLSTNDYTTTEKNKLSGIATDATKNDTDANLKNRANHTGSQAISTVTNLQTNLDGKVNGTTRITVSATAPSSPSANDLWVDIS